MSLAARITDLAVAIRDKINLMVPRLQPGGGTTGQVLAKTSNADYDSAWASVSGGVSPAWSAVQVTAVNNSLELYVNVIDVALTVVHDIEVRLAPGNEQDENEPDGLQLTCLVAVAKDGSMDLIIESDEPLNGPINLLYRIRQ